MNSGELNAMERTGEVTSVQGQWLEITFCRPADCEKCNACHGGPKTMSLRIKGKARVGDYAVVTLPESVVNIASFMVYAVPVIGLLAGMFIGDALLPMEHSLGGVIGGAVGVILPGVWLLLTEKKRQQDPRWKPQLVRIIPHQDEQ